MSFLEINPEPMRLWFAAAPSHGGKPEDEQDKHEDVGARSLRVLIVEDEFFISLDLQNLLQSLGHAVVGIAVSADEAVRIARREQPDVAIVDIRLIGVRDGIDAAADMLNQFGVPSIFVTANTDPATRARAHTAQPLAFLEKPVTAQRLKLGLRSVPEP
jgi:CheY-like chemotaxis protein